MKHNKNIFLTLILSMTFIISCEEDQFTTVVNIDIPEHESKLALSGNISSNESGFYIYLGKSQSILEDTEYNPVNNATVKLYENDVEISDLIYWESGGVYLFEEIFEYQEGASYKIEATHPTLGTASCTQVMPNMPTIQNAVLTIDGAITPDGYKEDELEVTIRDDGSTEDYYAVEFRKRKFSSNGHSDQDYFYLNAFDPIIEEGYNESVIFSDGSFNGNTYTLRFTTKYYGSRDQGEKPLVIVKSITRDKYLFERSRAIYDEAQYNPFTEPVIVHSNIENGYGMFTVNAVSEFVIE